MGISLKWAGSKQSSVAVLLVVKGPEIEDFMADLKSSLPTNLTQAQSLHYDHPSIQENSLTSFLAFRNDLTTQDFFTPELGMSYFCGIW